MLLIYRRILRLQPSTNSQRRPEKTTYVCEFGSFAYRVMPFGLKNAPAVFSRIVIKTFQDYIYKTMVVYFDDWKIYSMLKGHCKWLRLMLERCQ